eukprot:1161050-Pelagomonas_calceolata.AAC.9
MPVNSGMQTGACSFPSSLTHLKHSSLGAPAQLASSFTDVCMPFPSRHSCRCVSCCMTERMPAICMTSSVTRMQPSRMADLLTNNEGSLHDIPGGSIVLSL